MNIARGSLLAKSPLVKHQGRSVECYVERVKLVLDEIKHTRAEQFNPEKVLAKMDAILQTK